MKFDQFKVKKSLSKTRLNREIIDNKLKSLGLNILSGSTTLKDVLDSAVTVQTALTNKGMLDNELMLSPIIQGLIAIRIALRNPSFLEPVLVALDNDLLELRNPHLDRKLLEAILSGDMPLLEPVGDDLMPILTLGTNLYQTILIFGMSEGCEDHLISTIVTIANEVL